MLAASSRQTATLQKLLVMHVCRLALVSACRSEAWRLEKTCSNSGRKTRAERARDESTLSATRSHAEAVDTLQIARVPRSNQVSNQIQRPAAR